MKILYITDQIYLHGGAEKILIQKLNYWVEFFQYDVKLITTQQLGKKPFFPLNKKVKLVDLEVNYVEGVSFFSLKNISKLPLHYSKLKKEIKEYRPDAIFVISQSFVRYIVPLVAGKCVTFNEYHTSYYGFQLGYENASVLQKIKITILDHIIKITDSFYTKIIFLNQEEYNFYKLKNAIIIPNFYDDVIASNNDFKLNKIISLGRLCYQKGYDLLIEAWTIIDEEVQGWELEIYGNGADLIKLNEKIKTKNFKNNVKLNAAINNVNEKLSESSFYVMSSRFETFPMVLLEAMSNKLPIVSFDCPSGPRSIVTDGEDGILAKNNDVTDLAKKILFLIQNADIRNKMGERAFVNIKRFNSIFVMEQWNQLLIKSVAT